MMLAVDYVVVCYDRMGGSKIYVVDIIVQWKSPVG